MSLISSHRVAAPTKQKKATSFKALGLNDELLHAIDKLEYRAPTPIQRKTVPLLLQGRDLVAMARTGSGKTAAFLLPVLQLLGNHSEMVGARALVLSPTKDLALQTIKFVKMLCRYTDLRAALIVGGESMADQFQDLALNPDIIVATPGRLLHHLVEARYSLRRVKLVVCDEADRLFELGFQQQITDILAATNSNRQTALFSATLPSMVYEFAKAGLRQPKLIRLDQTLKLPPRLDMNFFLVNKDQKVAAFLYVLNTLVRTRQTIVFCSTKHHTLFLQHLLRLLTDERAGVVYGSMDAEARRNSVEDFREKRSRVLLVTDVAARGIDIPTLECVINYDMPASPKIFLHRVGRVGRGHSQTSGTQRWPAYSILSSRETPWMMDLHTFLNRKVSCELGDEGDEVSRYGRMPSAKLETEIDRFRSLLKSDATLAAMWRTCLNAAKNFDRTKNPPSREAVDLSKALDMDALHPMLLAVEPGEAERLEFVATYLKSFRPKQTIFEFKNPHDSAAESMQQKRAEHAVVAPTSKYRDERFFLKRQRNTHEDAVEKGLRVKDSLDNDRDVIMDMVGDDPSAIKKPGHGKVWDRKKKRFVGGLELTDGKRVNESGATITVKRSQAQRGTIYSDWKKATHKEIPKVGEREDAKSGEMYQQIQRARHQKRRGFGDGGMLLGGPRAPGANELLNADQVKRQRKIKEKNKAKNAPKKRKGGPGGGRGGGKRGKGGGKGGKGGKGGRKQR